MSDDASKPKCTTVADGVLDKKTYIDRTKTPVKILFALKEVNSPNGDFSDLCEFLVGKDANPPWQTWNNVVRWALALGAVQGDADARAHISDERRKSVLKHVAVINMKKTPGGRTSNYKEIVRAAEESADIIKRQISECDPDIIICGGSGVSVGLERALGGTNLHWIEAGDRRYGKHGNAIVLDYWHPQYTKNTDEMLEGIVKLYRDAEKEFLS